MHPLDEWRKSKRLTLKEAAKELGFSHGSLLDYIYYRRYPGPARVEKIITVTDGTVTAYDLHHDWQSQNKGLIRE